MLAGLGRTLFAEVPLAGVLWLPPFQEIILLGHMYGVGALFSTNRF
jgi:hypothetical protein